MLIALLAFLRGWRRMTPTGGDAAARRNRPTRKYWLGIDSEWRICVFSLINLVAPSGGTGAGGLSHRYYPPCRSAGGDFVRLLRRLDGKHPDALYRRGDVDAAPDPARVLGRDARP